jgi:hypothetical protein
MEQQMELAEFLAGLRKHRGDFLVLGHIARQDQGVGTESGGQFLDIAFESFALIGESERGAGLAPGLRDGPGDGPLVGHAENQPDFSSKY